MKKYSILTGHCWNMHLKKGKKASNPVESEGWRELEKRLQEKPSIFDSKLAAVKQNLVFHKMFTIWEKEKYILRLKYLLAPRSLKRASEGFFFFFAGHFIISYILKGISEWIELDYSALKSTPIPLHFPWQDWEPSYF